MRSMRRANRSRRPSARGRSEIVFTSGATESNNLAIRGVAERPRRQGQPHRQRGDRAQGRARSAGSPGRRGFEVTLLPVEQAGSPRAGWLDPQTSGRRASATTRCWSRVMLANNEIGVIQPIAEIGRDLPAARRAAALRRHAGRRQDPGRCRAAWRRPDELLGPQDLRPEGHRRPVRAAAKRRHVRLEPQIDGGGQEHGLRSGTLNVPGIVGLRQGAGAGRQRDARGKRAAGALRRRLLRRA